MSEIDTTNKFMVSTTPRDEFVMIMLPVRRLPREDALNLAAYIVALVDPLGEEFSKVLEAIENV
jgi:hypothetical protein